MKKQSKSVEPPSVPVPVKRPLVHSESSDSDSDKETRPPPTKYGSVEDSDVDSQDQTDTELADIGACEQSVNVTNPTVNKMSLLSQLMATHQSRLEQNQRMIERMMSQVEKL